MTKPDITPGLVSIIMPALNADSTILESLTSVGNQTHKNIELIIIDNGSVDLTINIIEKFIGSNPLLDITFLRERQKGVHHARNQGIHAARGQYICFLDSDDTLTSQSIELRVNFLMKNPVYMVHGSYIRSSSQSQKLVRVKDIVDFEDMLKFNEIPNLTGMYDCQKIGKVFQPHTRHEDYCMWSEILRRGYKSKSVAQTPIAYYKVHSNSLSSNKIKSFYWHWLALMEINPRNIAVNIYYQGCYIFKSLYLRLK